MKRLSAPLIVAALFVLTGCIDNLWDDSARNQLEIWEDPPPEGQVGEPYEFRVGARVKNTPKDDDYDFRFGLVDGELPPGTRFEQEDIFGTVYAYIRGVPTKAGNYSFAIEVRSDKLARELNQEIDDESSDIFASPNTVDRDEGLYTIYIVE